MAWRYACNIPTYITGKDESGEPVVLYRVNVFFQQQSPDGPANGGSNTAPGADSAPFFVLRRYSQFRHLHDQLKAAFPAIMSGRGMAPPPKHPLVLGLGGDKQDALERRRVELERWLWRLVATPEVARGSQLKSFLELDKALARAQQHQQRQRLEQQQQQRQHHRLTMLDGDVRGPDLLRGSSSTAPPSESGYSYNLGGRNHHHHHQQHLTSYPGGGGGASVLGDDSASDASGASGAASTAGALWSLTPATLAAAAAAAASAGPAGARGGGGDSGPSSHYSVPPDPRATASGLREHKLHVKQPGGPSPAEAVAPCGPGGAGTVGAVSAARLGIHLQSRGDVRRLVDLLVQNLDAACSEAASAVSEVSLLRDANRAMAERLGELELERAEREEGPTVRQARALLAESEAARLSLERRVAQLDETLASRSTAHAQQVAQLQSQLSEARTDNTELLKRLQEWDVGGSNSATALAAAEQRVEELQQQLDEQQQRMTEQQQALDEQERRLDEQQRQANEQQLREDELQKRLDEQAHGNSDGTAASREREEEERREVASLQGLVGQLALELEEAKARAEALQRRLEEQERQLADERKRREQAEAAAARQQPAAPVSQQSQPQQHQALLDRARADNALLAQEVQRVRTAAAAEREAHNAALAAHSQASAELAARVRGLEAQLAAATAAAAVPPAPTQTQELLLL